ncbi:15999_t:CDS:2 [Funneliformis mosseae]|uniref:15999_t:CDS:1 n=1 Tax=Funneliformis mosseae TaxID=27381 RepID=A0A9N9HY63_FUNMO|nr:15999_t:CDS:2 [Funneliformis mosseae]
MKLDENESTYSNPKNFLSLLYPYLSEKLPIDRFAIDNNRYFNFMGRKEFRNVLETINKLRSGTGYMKLFVYVDPVDYTKSVLFLAYHDNDAKINEINSCENFENIVDFCKKLQFKEKLYFIIDQMNALDELDNTGTMLHLMQKQTGELKIKLYGRFNEEEMEEW